MTPPNSPAARVRSCGHRHTTKASPGVAALIKTFTRRVADLLRRFFTAVLAVLLGDTDAPDDTPDDADTDTDLDDDVLGVTDLVRSALRALFTIIRAAFVAVFVAMWIDGAAMGRGIERRRHDFDIDTDIEDDATLEQLRENGRRAAEQVEHRIIGDLAEALVEAHDAGLSIEEIADVLREEVMPDVTGWQSRRISQTEVQSAVNKGRLTAFQDADVPGKRWSARDDHRTRATHDAADGQTRPLDEPFDVGAAEGMFPGSPEFPPQERINCRCSLSPVFDMD